MMKVTWFKLAIWDLTAIRDYIGKDNPAAALRTVRRIKEAVSSLSEQPGIGRPGRVLGTKELVIDQTPYILPYRVHDNRIEILRVFHTSRQWPKHF